MYSHKIYLFILILMLGILQTSMTVAQDSTQVISTKRDSIAAVKHQKVVPPQSIDQKWKAEVESIKFNDTPIRDVLQAIAMQNDLNLVVTDNVDTKVTFYFKKIAIWDLIQYLADTYKLSLQWQGNILKVTKPDKEEETKSVPGEFHVELTDSLITIKAQDYSLKQAAQKLTELTSINVLVDQDLNSQVSGYLESVPIVDGLQMFFKYNHLRVRKWGNVLFVGQGETGSGGARSPGMNQWVTVFDDSTISLDLVNAPVEHVIQQISENSNISIINYNQIPGALTAKTQKLSLNQTLDLLLKNTNYTYRIENGIYLIGETKMEGMATRELIRLKHLKSSGIKDLLPVSIKSQAEIIEVKELNSIVVIGSRKIVDEARAFIQDIDHIVPQILIEALVVDYRINDMKEFQLKFGIDKQREASAIQLYPFIEGTTTKDAMQSYANTNGSDVLAKNIGFLPDNFYAQLSAMEQEGYAKIQSKPHIATLNGNKASLVISTTQYYIFKSEVVVPTSSQPTTQTTQRFEKISAEIKLEITPWVSAGGEITTEIHPEFSTPVGSFNPDVPPTINSRIFDSTVRLQDGETIVLGGLIRNDDSKNYQKFPILGDIPLIGWFFRSHSIQNETSELVIYITPHLNMPPVNMEDKHLLKPSGE